MGNKILREALRHRFISMKLDRHLWDIEEASLVLFELCADLVEEDGSQLNPAAILAKAEKIDINGNDRLESISDDYHKKVISLRHDPRICSEDSKAVHQSIVSILGRRLGLKADSTFDKKISDVFGAMMKKHASDPMDDYRKLAMQCGKNIRFEYQDLYKDLVGIFSSKFK